MPAAFLVVDSDPVAREWIAQALESEAGEIVCAADGVAAWLTLSAGCRPSACICAARMPRVNGLELVQYVRADPALGDLPTIVLFAPGDIPDGSSPADTSTEWLTTPVPEHDLRRAVRTLVRRCTRGRAEPAELTLRRLATDQGTLTGRLMFLAADIQSWGTPAGMRTLEELSREAERLGLWRCAALLRAAHHPASGYNAQQLQLTEASELAKDQLDALIEGRPRG